jgi:glycogen synthase
VFAERGRNSAVRAVAVGIAIALVVWVISGGHVFFLPLLFIPLGLFSFGRRRSNRRY